MAAALGCLRDNNAKRARGPHARPGFVPDRHEFRRVRRCPGRVLACSHRSPCRMNCCCVNDCLLLSCPRRKSKALHQYGVCTLCFIYCTYERSRTLCYHPFTSLPFWMQSPAVISTLDFQYQREKTDGGGVSVNIPTRRNEIHGTYSALLIRRTSNSFLVNCCPHHGRLHFLLLSSAAVWCRHNT